MPPPQLRVQVLHPFHGDSWQSMQKLVQDCTSDLIIRKAHWRCEIRCSTAQSPGASDRNMTGAVPAPPATRPQPSCQAAAHRSLRRHRPLASGWRGCGSACRGSRARRASTPPSRWPHSPPGTWRSHSPVPRKRGKTSSLKTHQAIRAETALVQLCPGSRWILLCTPARRLLPNT